MKAHSLLHFLGHASAEQEFDTFLNMHCVHARPHHAEEDESYDEDPEQAEENAEYSLLEEVERLSICLIYEDRANYERLFGKAKGQGDFILKEVAFYAAGIQQFPGFSGTLPFNLGFVDGKDSVRRKLGMPSASRQVHEMLTDLFLREDMTLNVSYLNQGGSIAIVHVRLPHLYDLRVLGKLNIRDRMSPVELARLIDCLGRSAYDFELSALLQPFDSLLVSSEMADCNEVMELVERYGLTLYYRDAADYLALYGKRFAKDGAVFAGFRVNRRGDMNSEGFGGVLPFGIEFHHSPERLVALVGREPDRSSMGDDIGSFMWKVSGYILHVMFSLIDYQVYRVSCFARFMEEELFNR